MEDATVEMASAGNSQFLPSGCGEGSADLEDAIRELAISAEGDLLEALDAMLQSQEGRGVLEEIVSQSAMAMAAAWSLPTDDDFWDEASAICDASRYDSAHGRIVRMSYLERRWAVSFVDEMDGDEWQAYDRRLGRMQAELRRIAVGQGDEVQ